MVGVVECWCQSNLNIHRSMNTTTTTTSRSATHYGICQLCGSLQKAPGGRLAKHGYDVQYGFFNGICRGSHELPYEESCDLLVAVLAGIKVAIANYTEAPKPARTTPGKFDRGYNRFKCQKDPQWIADERALAQWRAGIEQHAANQRFVPFAEARIAAWVPAALIPVAVVEAKEQAVKSARKGIQALSKAVDLAKRALTKNLDFYRSTVENAANVKFHAAKTAFFAANPGVIFWPGAAKAKFVTAGGNNVTTVPKLIAQLREFGFAEHADTVEALNAAYVAAKAAHEAARA